jgi:hypothetical protein
VTTTAFSTLYLKNALRFDAVWGCARGWVRELFWVSIFMLCAALPQMAYADTSVDLQNLKLERQGDGIYVSGDWRFELPGTLEDALLKGVSLYFVAEFELTQERWYFYEKRIAQAERHVKLAYQPLTRRWRASVSTQSFQSSGLGAGLGQSYANLDEALQVVRRLNHWRVASASDLSPESKQNMLMKFKLDLSQLPRPLQIGAMTQTEWNINFTKTQRLQLETER